MQSALTVPLVNRRRPRWATLCEWARANSHAMQYTRTYDDLSNAPLQHRHHDQAACRQGSRANLRAVCHPAHTPRRDGDHPTATTVADKSHHPLLNSSEICCCVGLARSQRPERDFSTRLGWLTASSLYPFRVPPGMNTGDNAVCGHMIDRRKSIIDRGVVVFLHFHFPPKKTCRADKRRGMRG